jgi:hypothetical protein
MLSFFIISAEAAAELFAAARICSQRRGVG